MTRRLTRALAIALGCAGIAAATPGARQVFRGGTDVVLLSVTVLDAKGRLVAGLSKEDFQVFEDGVLQDISNFSREAQPIALSLVLDSSTSMELKLGIAQEAATGFARRLAPRDIAQVIDFDSQARILQTFTGDKALLETAIRRTQAGGSTSLYNAVYQALSELKRLRAETTADIHRQAIVVLSDGEDTSSLVAYEEVLELAKRSDVAVYAIGLRMKNEVPTRGWNEAEFVLRSLAQETGGRSYSVGDANQLPAIYSQIADELANQYTVGYTSKNSKRDGAWRRINVRVARESTTARTKAGYFGPKAAK